jgi:hypothetical protein
MKGLVFSVVVMTVECTRLNLGDNLADALTDEFLPPTTRDRRSLPPSQTSGQKSGGREMVLGRRYSE